MSVYCIENTGCRPCLLLSNQAFSCTKKPRTYLSKHVTNNLITIEKNKAMFTSKMYFFVRVHRYIHSTIQYGSVIMNGPTRLGSRAQSSFDHGSDDWDELY